MKRKCKICTIIETRENLNINKSADWEFIIRCINEIDGDWLKSVCLKEKEEGSVFYNNAATICNNSNWEDEDKYQLSISRLVINNLKSHSVKYEWIFSKKKKSRDQ